MERDKRICGCCNTKFSIYTNETFVIKDGLFFCDRNCRDNIKTKQGGVEVQIVDTSKHTIRKSKRIKYKKDGNNHVHICLVCGDRSNIASFGKRCFKRNCDGRQTTYTINSAPTAEEVNEIIALNLSI